MIELILAVILWGCVVHFWSNRKTVTRVLPSPVPRQPIELTDKQIEDGIRDISHLLIENQQKFFTDKISAVQCTVKFPGWGFVAGRTQGWWINNKLTVCEGDNDLGYSEICIAVENKAAILLERRYDGDIAGRCVTRLQLVTPELENVLLFRGKIFENIEDFKELPTPVQRVMIDVIAALLARKKQFQLDDPTDAILRYQS